MDQKSLFNVQPPQWQLDDQDDWLAARIAFATAPYGPYDYSIPSNLEQAVQPGVRVEVSLGRGSRKMIGYCIDVIGPGHADAGSVNPSRLKPIDKVFDAQPLMTPGLLRLAKWIADYYVSPVGQVIETIVPPGVRNDSGTREMLFLRLADDVIGRLDELKVTELQLRILTTLAGSNQDWTPNELAATVGCTMGPVSTLRRKGLIVGSTRRVQQKTHEIPREVRTSNLQLNDEQQLALDAIVQHIEQDSHQTFLMHGVTGSGKTEVYIQAIQKVVSFGKQAIVLVPEISLTPQTRQRFRARFDQVAVLHSHLTAAQRAWHWKQIAAGKVQVIVGARSAVFAPAPNLGLIVLDEEHDGSFKQDKAPRYHARDVADFRARDQRVPLILGSATPSLESWQRSLNNQYRKLTLEKRVLDLPLPDVATIDMRVDFGGRRRFGPISQKLRQEIDVTLKAGGQVILLLNRRGFSTRIQCPACGYVEICPDCEIPLTHHHVGAKAICHFCDYGIAQPEVCSQCKNPAIRFTGLGTQKLEAHVRATFPEATVLRMDTDTMKRPGSHEKALAKFRAGEVQILLGTQMIAKGLDFPNVTLVGVVNADTALHLPDFRASERSFGLVTQVAGRTGRGEQGGRVLVQTFNPEHPAIVAATRHDYLGFAAGELPQRAELGYPPYGHLARVIVRGEAQAKTHDMADLIAQQIGLVNETERQDVRVLGPAPAPVEKLRGQYRFHLLAFSNRPGALQQVIRKTQHAIKPVDGVLWVVDIDPQNMM